MGPRQSVPEVYSVKILTWSNWPLNTTLTGQQTQPVAGDCNVSSGSILLWPQPQPGLADMYHVTYQLRRNLWHHFESTGVGQKSIIHPLNSLGSLVGIDQHWDTLEYRWTTPDTICTSQDAFCEPYISNTSPNGFWWQLYHWYLRTASYYQWERSILIPLQS